MKADGEGETESKMVSYYHRFNRHEFEQTPRDSRGQRNLVCHSPWCCRVRHGLATKKQYKSIFQNDIFNTYYQKDITKSKERKFSKENSKFLIKIANSPKLQIFKFLA